MDISGLLNTLSGTGTAFASAEGASATPATSDMLARVLPIVIAVVVVLLVVLLVAWRKSRKNKEQERLFSQGLKNDVPASPVDARGAGVPGSTGSIGAVVRPGQAPGAAQGANPQAAPGSAPQAGGKGRRGGAKHARHGK